MNTTQILYEVRQPESKINLVQGTPAQEGQKLSQVSELELSWKEFQGLSWIIMEEY